MGYRAPNSVPADTVKRGLRGAANPECWLKKQRQQIIISELALKFGFSPGSVREALSRLAAERMTVATAQKGYTVADVSIAELKDLVPHASHDRANLPALGDRTRRRRMGDLDSRGLSSPSSPATDAAGGKRARQSRLGRGAWRLPCGARQRLRQPMDADAARFALRPERALSTPLGRAGARTAAEGRRTQRHSRRVPRQGRRSRRQAHLPQLVMKTMHIILNSPLLANRPGDEGN